MVKVVYGAACFIFALLFVCLFGLPVLAADPPAATSTATISITPGSGIPGTAIALYGTGFKKSGAATVTFDNEVVAEATADAFGMFAVIFKAPALKPGDHVISAADGESTRHTGFRITAAAVDASNGETGFTRPRWGSFALSGLGGILIFVFGVWVGRNAVFE